MGHLSQQHVRGQEAGLPGQVWKPRVIVGLGMGVASSLEKCCKDTSTCDSVQGRKVCLLASILYLVSTAKLPVPVLSNTGDYRPIT